MLRYNTSMGSQEKFGHNLRLARKKADLTQQQVAEKAKLHTNYYARVERGEENPSYEVLEKIIKALKIKSSDVFPF